MHNRTMTLSHRSPLEGSTVAWPRRGCRLACLMLALALSAFQPAFGELQELTIEFFPNGDRGQGHPIRMVFEAEVDRDGRPLEAPAPPPAAGTAERFLADYIGVLRGGTVEAAMPFWLDSERAAARQRLAPVFEQQKAIYATVTQSRLYTKVRYGRYLLAAVEHLRAGGAEPLVTMYPLVVTGDGYALSNGPHQDPMFQILYFTFLDGVGLGDKLKTVN